MFHVVDVEKLAEPRVGLHVLRVWRETKVYGVTALYVVLAVGHPIDVIALGS